MAFIQYPGIDALHRKARLDNRSSRIAAAYPMTFPKKVACFTQTPPVIPHLDKHLAPVIAVIPGNLIQLTNLLVSKAMAKGFMNLNGVKVAKYEPDAVDDYGIEKCAGWQSEAG